LFNELPPPSTGSSDGRNLCIHEELWNQQRRPFPTTTRRFPVCDEPRGRFVFPSAQVHILTNHCLDTSSRIPCTYQLEINRNFFSSGHQHQQQQQPSKRSAPKAILANEELIERLVRDADGASSHTINVRLVIDEGINNPPTVSVTTLTDAVKLSLDRNADLIGSSLDSDPPVIRLAQLSKLQYRAGQKQKKQHQQAAASTKKEKKSFRFKTGIDSHDLDRKVAQLTGYLQKGNDCEYTVFSRARTLRENENAGIELVDKIQALIGDHGVLKRAPETNETKSFYRVQLAPKIK
jgi:translation initiation factor IF-3